MELGFWAGFGKRFAEIQDQQMQRQEFLDKLAAARGETIQKQAAPVIKKVREREQRKAQLKEEFFTRLGPEVSEKVKEAFWAKMGSSVETSERLLKLTQSAEEKYGPLTGEKFWNFANVFDTSLADYSDEQAQGVIDYFGSSGADNWITRMGTEFASASEEEQLAMIAEGEALTMDKPLSIIPDPIESLNPDAGKEDGPAYKPEDKTRAIKDAVYPVARSLLSKYYEEAQRTGSAGGHDAAYWENLQRRAENSEFFDESSFPEELLGEAIKTVYDQADPATREEHWFEPGGGISPFFTRFIKDMNPSWGGKFATYGQTAPAPPTEEANRAGVPSVIEMPKIGSGANPNYVPPTLDNIGVQGYPTSEDYAKGGIIKRPNR